MFQWGVTNEVINDCFQDDICCHGQPEFYVFVSPNVCTLFSQEVSFRTVWWLLFVFISLHPWWYFASFQSLEEKGFEAYDQK